MRNLVSSSVVNPVDSTCIIHCLFIKTNTVVKFEQKRVVVDQIIVDSEFDPHKNSHN